MSTVRRVFARLHVSLVLVGLLAAAAPAAADVVTDWNAIAVGVWNGVARPAPVPPSDLAMMHIAMHDAVQAYQHRFKTYNAPIPNAAGSVIAAVATAARDVLVSRLQLPTPNAVFIAQVNATYADYLAANGLLPGDAGVLVGQQAAMNIIVRRANDGSWPANPEVFTGSTGLGEWRDARGMTTPWLGQVTPFGQRDTDELRPEPPPPDLTTGAYTKAYNEVKLMGRRTPPHGRTSQQTTMALFYGGNFLTQTQGTLRTVALARINDVGDSARLFALATMSAADALINAWDNKRVYNFWRPSTAIHNGEGDGNPRTAGDAAWLPLFPPGDPPYPDYTSGANSITGATMRALENFFGDNAWTFNVSTTATENGQPIPPRTYQSFSAVADDVVEARILLGIHFRFADVVARRQAKQSADQAFAHTLQRLN